MLFNCMLKIHRLSSLLQKLFIAFFVLSFDIHLGYSSAAQSDTVKYTYTVTYPNLRTGRVKMEFYAGDRDVTLQMPGWTPGSYRMRDYGENVSDFSACDGHGSPLIFRQEGKNTWHITNTEKLVSVEYQVAHAYQSWSGLDWDSSYVLVEGPDVFMYSEVRRTNPVLIQYEIPESASLATALPKAARHDYYFAQDYDELIDSPAQIGRFEKFGFDIDETPIELVFHGNMVFSADDFIAMVEKISRYQLDFWGDVPFSKFVFFYKILPGYRSGGGLEHRSSTTIGLSEELLKWNILSAAEVTAHEFFHAWNVKKIKPVEFIQPDFSEEARINSLWFFEGVTSYYEAITMLRSGLWNRKRFLDEMVYQIERLERTDERKYTSVEAASFNTWERGYTYPGVSFYNMGAVLGLLLDLKIRHESQNAVSLDDVLQTMNYSHPILRSGDILKIINKVSQADFTEFFENYVSGTKPLPYADSFAFAGFELQKIKKNVSYIGEFAIIGALNTVISVEPDSPVYNAGLRLLDSVKEIAGTEIHNFAQMKQEVNKLSTGDAVQIEIVRDGKIKKLYVEAGVKETDIFHLISKEYQTELEREIQTEWLRSPNQSNGF